MNALQKLTPDRKKDKGLEIEQWWRVHLQGLQAFCADARIRRELTIPYNPQQNGVAERKNRAIIRVAKEMIHDQNMPMFL